MWRGQKIQGNTAVAIKQLHLDASTRFKHAIETVIKDWSWGNKFNRVELCLSCNFILPPAKCVISEFSGYAPFIIPFTEIMFVFASCFDEVTLSF